MCTCATIFKRVCFVFFTFRKLNTKDITQWTQSRPICPFRINCKGCVHTPLFTHPFLAAVETASCFFFTLPHPQQSLSGVWQLWLLLHSEWSCPRSSRCFQRITMVGRPAGKHTTSISKATDLNQQHIQRQTLAVFDVAVGVSVRTLKTWDTNVNGKLLLLPQGAGREGQVFWGLPMNLIIVVVAHVNLRFFPFIMQRNAKSRTPK